MQETVLEREPFLKRTFTLGDSLAWCAVSLAVLVLGAHFYRGGNLFMVAVTVGVLALHCGVAAWKRYTVAFFLALGVMEWGDAAFKLASIRMHMNAPWMRGAAILAVVAALTAFAAGRSFRVARLKAASRPEGGIAAGSARPVLQAAVFIAVIWCLYHLRRMHPNFLLLERFIPQSGGVQAFALAWYAAWIAGCLARPRTSRKTRRAVWLFFSCMFFGQLILGLLGVDGLLSRNGLHIPVPAFILLGPLFRGDVGMMPFLVLGAVLLTGSAWCSMLCYFGPLDSAIGGGKIRPLPPRWEPLLRYGRVGTLCSCVALTLILRFFHVPTAKALAVALVFAALSFAVMGALSFRHTGMMHCTAFCPMGLVVSLLARLSPWRVKVDAHACTQCGACETVCSYRAITRESRERGGTLMRCTTCRDCVAVCPHGAAFLSGMFMPKAVAEHVFIFLVTVVHIVFLAMARM